MTDVYLTLNSGSSSLKFAIFRAGSSFNIADIHGKVEGIGRAPTFSAKDGEGHVVDPGALGTLSPDSSHDSIIKLLLPWLDLQLGTQEILAVGHRVVHGGKQFADAVRITDDVLVALDAFVPLAPLHQPHNLAAIRAVSDWRADLPQVACFDTSFHRTQNPIAERFALPRAMHDEGIIRYGFHGLSYDYIAQVLPDHLGEKANGRVITAHLGNGASMCAMKARRSAATSMGFTALDGLMMGRRSGTLDPGILLYLMQEKGMDAGEIETLLYRKSGLLGVSGISNNMQVLETSDAPEAAEAIALFCYRAATTLAGLIPAIGGLDAVVFTAGIGENSATVRAGICEHLKWLGVDIDPEANAGNQIRINSAASDIPVLVIPTNEEAVVAQTCHRLLS